MTSLQFEIRWPAFVEHSPKKKFHSFTQTYKLERFTNRDFPIFQVVTISELIALMQWGPWDPITATPSRAMRKCEKDEVLKAKVPPVASRT